MNLMQRGLPAPTVKRKTVRCSWDTCVAFFTILLLVGRTSFAQGYSPDAIERARALFSAGLSAMHDARFQDALTSFSQAYALVPQPQTLLNLAGAQTETGRLVEAAESYRSFLREAASGPAASYREQAERALGEIERRLARVHIELSGGEGNESVNLDGRLLAAAELRSELRVDPGQHVLVARRGPSDVARMPFVVGEGEARSVSFVLPSAPASISVRTNRARVLFPSPSDARSVASQRRYRSSGSPWPWVGAAAALLVVGAVVGAVVWFATEPAPYRSDLPPVQL
jgi:hypothetical protein